MTTNDPRKKPRQERPRAGDVPRCRLCGRDLKTFDVAGILRQFCEFCNRWSTPCLLPSQRPGFKQLEPYERAKAKARMKAGKAPDDNPGVNFPQGRAPKTSDHLAKLAGVSGKTYEAGKPNPPQILAEGRNVPDPENLPEMKGGAA